MNGNDDTMQLYVQQLQGHLLLVEERLKIAECALKEVAAYNTGKTHCAEIAERALRDMRK